MMKDETSFKNKLGLFSGLAGPLFFVAIFLIEGLLRDAYLPSHHPVSSLAIGKRGWIQISNFLISGFLILLFGLNLRKNKTGIKELRRTSRLLIWIGVGLMGAGIFKTDPVYGYPMDAPLILAQFSTTGHLHDLFSLVVFVCLPWACFVMRLYFIHHGESKWANYSLLSALVVIITFILSGMGFKQVSGLAEMGGLLQRLCIISGCAWVAALAAYFLRKIPS